MLFHKMLDNSLFSVFLTSFLSHFETSQKKSYLQFYDIFFSKATFFHLNFFSVSPNLANIRVDFAHNLIFFYLFFILDICDLLPKNQVSIFYIGSKY